MKLIDGDALWQRLGTMAVTHPHLGIAEAFRDAESIRCDGCRHKRIHSAGKPSEYLLCPAGKPSEYLLCLIGCCAGYDSTVPPDFGCCYWEPTP